MRVFVVNRVRIQSWFSSSVAVSVDVAASVTSWPVGMAPVCVDLPVSFALLFSSNAVLDAMVCVASWLDAAMALV